MLAKYQHVLLEVAFCELDTGSSILVHKLWLSEVISTVQLQISHSTTWQLNKIIASSDRIYAFGFSLSKWSSWAKSLSLTVFVFGSDVM